MRNRKRKRSEDGDGQVTDSPLKAGPGQLMSTALMATKVGSVRALKPYALTDSQQVCPVALKQLIPFGSFRGGFRDAAEDSTNDTAMAQEGWDPSGIDGTSLFTPATGMKATIDALTLEAATPVAHRFTQSIWPSYDRAFRTSLKSLGTVVTFNEFVAVTALTMELQSLLLDVQMYIQLSNGIGNPVWDELANQYGESYKLQSRTFLQRVENSALVAAGIPALYGVVREICRMKSPFILPSSRGTVLFPVEYTISEAASRTSQSSKVHNAVTKIDLILSILRGEYADQVASMKRHMPYSLGDAGFMDQLPIIIDPIKGAGVINFVGNPRNISGNEGNLDPVFSLMIQQDAAAVGFLPIDATFQHDDQPYIDYDEVKFFHTYNPVGVTLGELASSAIYLRDNDVTDREFALAGFHQWGIAVIPSDDGTYAGITWEALNANVCESYPWIADALGLLIVTLDTNVYYMPEAYQTTLDAEGIIRGFRDLLHLFMDTPQMDQFDELAQASAAPVRSAPIDQVRSSR